MDTFKISNENYLTIIEAFSRYGKAYQLKSMTGTSLLNNLTTFIIHHGMSQKSTTGCGIEFKNYDLINFCKLHHIELHYIPKNNNSNSPVEGFTLPS